MAPNHAIAAMCDDEAQKETFYMSNITPQSKGLNQRWWERLERAEFSYFTHIFKEVWVVDGPVFGAHPVLLPNGPVQVPDACYKVFIAHKGDQWHVLAFMVDQGVNGDEAFSQYRVSISEIEQRIGFDLLPNLPNELKTKLKQDKTDQIWKLSEVDHLPTRF
jgi:endonuclease G